MGKTVVELMSRSPVVVDAYLTVEGAQRIAEARAVHHLLVVDESALVGVVCLCDLAESMPDVCVSRRMRSPVIWTSESDTLEQAAGTMLLCGVGCLPVLEDGDGKLSGILTRRDLRRAGILPGERGVDLCAACGTSHRLRAPDVPDLPVFCFDCLEQAPPSSGRHAIYYTLGGSG